jgi:signal transduction histidine kinase
LSVVAIYIAQSVLGIALFFIFRHFSRVYRRNFLYSWALSWLLFAASVWLLAFITFQLDGKPSNYLPSLFATFGHLTFTYLQVFLLLTGVYEFITGVKLRANFYRGFIALILVLATLSTILFSTELTNANERYFLRIGLRNLIVALSFVIAGITIAIKVYRQSGVGYKILIASLILYGISQAYYFWVVIAYIVQWKVEFPSFFGITDLLLMASMGMGLIIWMLEDERERLNKTNRELDSFLYSTSHDLRAPIASILGLANLARLEMTEKKGLELVGMMEERVKKLDDVISDILNLSKSKNATVKMEMLSFDQLIDDVVADLKFAKNAHSIRLIYDRSPQNTIVSDAGLLKTVIGNLFSNSVKYHRIAQQDPFIKVLFRIQNKSVIIELEDNGQGIRAESVSRIFDMFYRASTESNGTGLGLYIVKEALNKLNGRIEVRSKVNVGTTFIITLPQIN